MNKILNIYIDHYGDHNTIDGNFAKKLKERIKSIRKPFNILTYTDLPNKTTNGEEESIQEIMNADIIITLISADYLRYVPPLENIFNSIIESDNKYLFPLLYRASDWTEYNWIVKSKLIPEDNIPLSEHSDNDSDKIINNLVSKINDIITTNSKENSTSNVIIKKLSTTENSVFISHDHDDGDFAELLKLQLEKNGITGWIDNERLKIGQDWRQEIDDGIANSIAVIVIMTPEARKSEYVTYEWAFAWGKGKKIFPIMLKQTQLHPRLESLQYLDFTKRNSRPFESLIKSISDLI